jgi:GAF domain-containing protein
VSVNSREHPTERHESPSQALRATLLKAVAQLRADAGASRVTLRLALPHANFPVVAEAVADGIPRIAGDHSINQRDSSTLHFFQRTRRMLVVPDTRSSVPPTSPEVIERYGILAELVTPLYLQRTLVGVLAVHETRGPREWSAREIEAVTTTSEAILDLLRSDRMLRGAGGTPAYPFLTNHAGGSLTPQAPHQSSSEIGGPDAH